MKIGIVTWLGTGNFGTSLQSYALHRKLEEIGYDVCFLPYFSFSEFTLYGKFKKILRSSKHLAAVIFKRLFFGAKHQSKIQLFNKYNYNIRVVSTQKQYEKLLQNIDVFVTGSDQIWNCYHSFNPFYFLSFAGNVKRVAYASSIGTTTFPKDKESEIGALLSKFKHIGVREKTAVSLIKNLLNRTDVRQVVDPTFLLDKKHWLSFAENAKIEFEVPEKYILCYFVGNESCTEQQLEAVRQQLEINNIIVIPAMENAEIRFSNALIYRNAGPYEFVHLISHATCVCTDSFHATAISIITQKNFIEFMRFKDNDKKSQNSRIYDLLNHYGLMNRLYKSNDSTLFDPIDYTEVAKKVQIDREDCLEYLKNSIDQ
ncbi:polysaccharide pyruvyl transferase family protein [Mangrovibacterium marinum]|uniref:polysaccharide pyruvyl transferase family protein n=1 Tax=Mangrovibacterium marinum TaxID=1639118 RepID=UPI002A18DFA1|nr:polysaccharide pyruvyl transferase family protein [Mangrovibacterium marinum]